MREEDLENMAVVRLVGDSWFADVPAECAAWMNASSTLLVVAPPPLTPPDDTPHLLMRGHVLHARDGVAVVSCDGLLVSCETEARDGDAVEVLFTITRGGE